MLQWLFCGTVYSVLLRRQNLPWALMLQTETLSCISLFGFCSTLVRIINLLIPHSPIMRSPQFHTSPHTAQYPVHIQYNVT